LCSPPWSVSSLSTRVGRSSEGRALSPGDWGCVICPQLRLACGAVGVHTMLEQAGSCCCVVHPSRSVPKMAPSTYCWERGPTRGKGLCGLPQGLHTLHSSWGKHWHALTHVTLCGMWCVRGGRLQPAAPPSSSCTLPWVWGLAMCVPRWVGRTVQKYS
jgi:hypothetical protein